MPFDEVLVIPFGWLFSDLEVDDRIEHRFTVGLPSAADNEVEHPAMHSFLVEVLRKQIEPEFGVTLHLPDSMWHLLAYEHLVGIIGVDHKIVPELVLVQFIGAGEVFV